MIYILTVVSRANLYVIKIMDVFDMAVKKTGFSVNNVEPYGSVAED
jgi:hypothetical protein